MAEPPADTMHRAAAVVRERAELGVDVIERERAFLTHLADSWDALGDEMADYPAVRRPEGVGIAVLGKFQVSALWTASVQAARAYTGEEGPL